MISSITNRGRLAFMIFRQRFTAPGALLNFSSASYAATRKTRKKVFLIVDALPSPLQGTIRGTLAWTSTCEQILGFSSFRPIVRS